MNYDEEELRSMLKGLIAEKKNGKLDIQEKFDNQDVRWRNIVEYDLLWNCIKHRCNEIRKDTIELLAVSKQSTRRFIKAEFELIETFLAYNLGEKIEFVPSIKKVARSAIKRTRDSLIVLQRDLTRIEKVESLRDNLDNDEDDAGARDLLDGGASGIYSKSELEITIKDCESFLISIRDICIKNLYPTASYDRRRSSLQILRHMKDILNDGTMDIQWDENRANLLFDCLLLDTYDTNKDTIYEILKSVPPNLLKLDIDDWVADIIETAIGLANSIRPIDSATAAHMFKICTWSPVVVKNVVNRYAEFDARDYNDCEDVHLVLVDLIMLQLKKPLELARENIVKAASKHSLYGYIFCLRNLISDRDLRKWPDDIGWKKSIAKLVEICFDLNQAAGEIVNNSSPEGHLPMDLNPRSLPSSLLENGDSSESEVTTTPQMVLLCAWRTVKEVSLLFGYLTANLPIEEINGIPGLLTEHQVIKIGEHFVTLLSETKHRGAFEQAHVGFGQLCGRLWRQPEGGGLNKLPKIWLLELLLAVTGLSPRDGKLCATRRSAGVPFMVQALLTSEESSSAVIKHGGSFSFHSTMRILLGLTNLEDDGDIEARMTNLIYKDTVFSAFVEIGRKFNVKDRCCRLAEVKTHVINILRALFRHCQLGECVKPYIADGVISAIKSYNGKTWAERNAATLLFSAMMIRIFGVQRTKDHLNLSVHNKMTGKVFFERYPTLLGFMHAELEEFVKPGDTLIRPGVQSVLLLLSRLYPGCHDSEDSSWKVAGFIEMVSKCAKSPVYETRELAARALVPLLTETTSRVVFSKILETVSKFEGRNYSNVNTVHGYILQILQISRSAEFANFEPSSGMMKNFVVHSLWMLEKLEIRNRGAGISFPLATAYLETLLEIYKTNSEWLSECVPSKGVDLFPRIKLHLVENKVLSDGPGREVYEITAGKFFTYRSAREGDENSNFWTPLLRHENLDVRVVAWKKSAELVGAATNVDHSFRESQLRDALVEAEKAIDKSEIDDPNFEEAFFEFLYVILTESDRDNSLNIDPTTFPNFIQRLAKHLSKKLNDKNYYVRAAFLKLIGALYGQTSKHPNGGFTLEDKTAIYDLFLKNSWMDSCDNDCRLSVSQTIHYLYEPTSKSNDRFVMLWWTILLNLLVDDDKTVRQRAATVVCKIGERSEPACDVEMRREFFEKFTTLVSNKRPEIAMVILFAWGVATWREETHEMDDTDVFNRGRNYDSYEQFDIAKRCAIRFKELLKENPADIKFESNTVEFFQDFYDFDMKFSNLTEFLNIQSKFIPKVGKKLNDYLDPTYGDKLQQVLAFERFASCLMGEEFNNGGNA